MVSIIYFAANQICQIMPDPKPPKTNFHFHSKLDIPSDKYLTNSNVMYQILFILHTFLMKHKLFYVAPTMSIECCTYNVRNVIFWVLSSTSTKLYNFPCHQEYWSTITKLNDVGSIRPLSGVARPILLPVSDP